MRHRPSGGVLIELANEVPGGAELADEARRGPETLRVTETQFKFMRKMALLDFHGELVTLRGSSIRIEVGVLP